MSSLSVVIVTHGHAAVIGASLRALGAELQEGDEVIVVDNASPDDTPAAVRAALPDARIVETGANLGFPAACNVGAERADGELLAFLNPDAVPQPGWRAAVVAPYTDGRSWSAWQALVTSDGGRLVNTRGGVLHFTGIAWAGGAGEPVAAQPEDAELPEPGFVSGACLVLAREEFERVGRFPDEFFLYHEDVDLSLRVRLAGGRLGVAHDARVDHDYEFDKGPAKWRHLERNRWATLIRCYPAALLALLAPALLATELALIPASLVGGWGRQKLAAWADVARALPRLLRERCAVQARRRISAGQFARALTPALDSPYLGAAGRSRALGSALRAYWGVVRFVLRA